MKHGADSQRLFVATVLQGACRPMLLASLILLLAMTAWGASKNQRAVHPKPHATVEETALTKARERVQSATPLAMFYYTDDSLGLATLQAHSEAMTVLAPQCYALDRAGALHGRLPARVPGMAQSAGLPLMPLVTNAGFDRPAAHRLLHNLPAQQRAINLLAEAAKSEQYVGWQLDFEDLDPADKFAYSRFVARLGARLHRDRRLLSVAVVPRFSDTFPDTSVPGFHTGEWGAAYDYRSLGRTADFLVLMAYDQHTPSTPPGPVAGYDWVKALLDYAVQRVPPYKLVLGLPLYGREWAETTDGKTSHSFAYKDLEAVLQNPTSERHWDDVSQTSWFEWREGETVRTAWFDDARSLREKMKLARLYHLRGYAAWRLGMEDPDFWQPEAPEQLTTAP